MYGWIFGHCAVHWELFVTWESLGIDERRWCFTDCLDVCVFVLGLQRDSSRLDSMVLLLMKLDQLDKEIENALSATSSMDSTPTPRRRHLVN